MQVTFSGITGHFAQLRQRPVVCTVSAAAATVGAFYLFCRWRDHGERTRTAKTTETSCQTDCEEIWLSRRTLELSTPLDFSDSITRGSILVEPVDLNGQDEDVPTTLNPRGCVALDLIRPYSQSVMRTSSLVRFVFTRKFREDLREVEVTLESVTKVRGLETKMWLVLTNNFYTLSPEAPPQRYATVRAEAFIKRTGSEVVKMTSYLQTDLTVSTVFDGFMEKKSSVTYQGITIGRNGDFCRTESSETSTVYTAMATQSPQSTAPPQPNSSGARPQPNQSTTAPQSSQSTSPPQPNQPAATPQPNQSTDEEENVGVVSPEAREVPSLSHYITVKRITDFPTRLTGLRTAFTLLLSNAECRNHVIVAGRILLARLAALNGQDLTAFQQAYDQLVAFTLHPPNREGIMAELDEVGIHHFNFIDIVYELVFFGVFARARPPLTPRRGGFLYCLMRMIGSLTSPRGWQPAAQRCLLMIQAEMLALLNEVFSLDLGAYASPASLFLGLFTLLDHHVQLLMD